MCTQMPDVKIGLDCDCCNLTYLSESLEVAGTNYLVCVNCIASGFICQDCEIFVGEVIDPIQVVYSRCIKCQAKTILGKI